MVNDQRIFISKSNPSYILNWISLWVITNENLLNASAKRMNIPPNFMVQEEVTQSWKISIINFRR